MQTAILSCNASPKKRFDIVDIDPFGTPAPYLDSALRAIRNNGLLASTATDLAPLCGVHAKACIRKYGGRPLRTEYCHELAVRLLAGCTATVAAKHDIGIKGSFQPQQRTLHSLIHTNQLMAPRKQMKASKPSATSCTASTAYHRETTHQPFGNLQCPECGSKMDWAGPLWLGNIFDEDFIESMIKENKSVAFKNSARITKLLSLTKEEASAPITYFVVDKLSGKLGLPSPSIQAFHNALRSKRFPSSPDSF